MKHLRLPSITVTVPVLLVLLVLAGACSVLAGVYLLAGLEVALIVGGVAAVVVGLAVDA